MDTQGKRLEYLLKKEHLKQKDLADMVGLSTNYVSMIKTDQAPISKKLSKSIENATGYNAEWLLHGTGDPKQQRSNDYVTRAEFEAAIASLTNTKKEPETLNNQTVYKLLLKVAESSGFTSGDFLQAVDKLFKEVRLKHPDKTLEEGLKLL